MVCALMAMASHRLFAIFLDRALGENMFIIFFVIVFVISFLGAIMYRHFNVLKARSGEAVQSAQTPSIKARLHGRVNRVIDGDSLWITGADKQIRLWGVDAPERGEPGYHEATELLTSMALDKKVTVLQLDTDTHGRLVARVFVRTSGTKVELNKKMIDSRLANEYLKFTKGFYSKGA